MPGKKVLYMYRQGTGSSWFWWWLSHSHGLCLNAHPHGVHRKRDRAIYSFKSSLQNIAIPATLLSQKGISPVGCMLSINNIKGVLISIQASDPNFLTDFTEGCGLFCMPWRHDWHKTCSREASQISSGVIKKSVSQQVTCCSNRHPLGIISTTLSSGIA